MCKNTKAYDLLSSRLRQPVGGEWHTKVLFYQVEKSQRGVVWDILHKMFGSSPRIHTYLSNIELSVVYEDVSLRELRRCKLSKNSIHGIHRYSSHHLSGIRDAPTEKKRTQHENLSNAMVFVYPRRMFVRRTISC